MFLKCTVHFIPEGNIRNRETSPEHAFIDHTAEVFQFLWFIEIKLTIKHHYNKVLRPNKKYICLL